MFTPALRRVLASVVLVAAALLPAGQAASPAAAADAAPDGSHSHITQRLVHREALGGGGWRVTIEATLDSNTICHTLLYQCVVEPELAPANLTLETVQCLSPGWHQIKITSPVVGTVVDVCARFDHHRAGLDQKFRFTYRTPLDVGTVSETVKFFRFPEEFHFIRAQDTITINLAAQADILESCPDTATAGSPISCTVTVKAHSNVPTANVQRTPPAQFTNATLVPDANPGDWDCTALTNCAYTAGGGTLPIGEYTFTAAADVVGPAGAVNDCSAIRDDTTVIASDCDEVQVYDANIDTFVEVEKTASVTEVDPGAALTFAITVTNSGPNTAQDVKVFETPSALLEGTSIKYVSGAGDWTCSSGAPLECTAPTLAVGGVAIFEVAGVVSASAAGGSAILNEVTVEYPNDPFGPDYPVRAGTLVLVAGATAATPVSANPNFTG